MFTNPNYSSQKNYGTEKERTWIKFTSEIQAGEQIPFSEQLQTYHNIFGEQDVYNVPPKVWFPGAELNCVDIGRLFSSRYSAG